MHAGAGNQTVRADSSNDVLLAGGWGPYRVSVLSS